MVLPSGEGQIKGREGHFLSSLGGEIGEGKMVYPQEEKLRWAKENGGWEVSLQGERGKVSGIKSSATDRDEVCNLPVLSTFGVPRTGNHNI